MKNTIFLVVVACLLAGCAGKGQTGMKLKTEAEVTSVQGLPVKVMSYDEKPLPIRMVVPNEIAIGALIISLIAVVAASLAAIAAWRAADSTKRAAKDLLKIFKANLKK